MRMTARRRIGVCILAALLCSGCSVVRTGELPRAGEACKQISEPHRWANAGEPDIGVRPPLLSAHRGGVNLAPENTLAAYRHAFAYEMDFIEIDVRETADGVFISMHDDTVDRTTNGTGKVAELTWAQIQQLNAADFIPWKGSPYDSSPVPRLEQILELARDAGKGIEFDIKSVRNFPAFVDLVASYGVLSRSYFSISADRVSQAHAYNPEIRVIFNIDGDESPAALFAEAPRTAVFGSRLDKFTPEKIAAIHDGCAVVLPHSYDADEAMELVEFRRALDIGADGAQVNQPDVIAFVAKRRVPAKLVHLESEERVCLRNANNGFGLTQQTLEVQPSGSDSTVPYMTDRDGCIPFSFHSGSYVIRHDATPAVQRVELRVRVE